MSLFPTCSSSALGNIKFEGGACAACHKTLCSPKRDTGTLIMETRSCAEKTHWDFFSDFDYRCLSFVLGF